MRYRFPSWWPFMPCYDTCDTQWMHRNSNKIQPKNAKNKMLEQNKYLYQHNTSKMLNCENYLWEMAGVFEVNNQVC